MGRPMKYKAGDTVGMFTILYAEKRDLHGYMTRCRCGAEAWRRSTQLASGAMECQTCSGQSRRAKTDAWAVGQHVNGLDVLSRAPDRDTVAQYNTRCSACGTEDVHTLTSLKLGTASCGHCRPRLYWFEGQPTTLQRIAERMGVTVARLREDMASWLAIEEAA